MVMFLLQMNRHNPCQQLQRMFDLLPKNDFSALSAEADLAGFQVFKRRFDLFKQYQERVLHLLSEWSGLADFENQIEFEQNGRVVIQGDLSLTGRDVDYFPALIRKVEGKLTIDKTSIREVDYLEEVGALIISQTPEIKTMNNLVSVNGSLNLADSKIEVLPKLKWVRTDLYAQGLETLKALPALKSVGSLNLKASGIESLPVLNFVKRGDLKISKTSLTAIPRLFFVEGDFIAEDAPLLENLEELRRIEGSFKLYETAVEDLPKLLSVGGSFMVHGKSFQRAPLLGSVFGVVDVQETSLVGLPRLKHAFEGFNAEGVDSLVNLESFLYTEGNLRIKGTGIKVIPSLHSVWGLLSIGKLGRDGFRKLFPKLKFLGASVAGISLKAERNSVREEVEELRKQGKIRVRGQII
jgi:hypothetical protein